MKIIIRNEAPMNNSNCSTAQPLNNSTSDGVAIRVEKMKMKTKIKNVGQMNNSNCSTSQPLNTSTSDGVAIRVKKMKMETRIRKEASMNNPNCSTAQPLNNSTAQQFNKLASHPLTNSPTHLPKTPIIQVKHLSKRYQIGMDI